MAPPRPPWMRELVSVVGVKEVPGPASNPLIVEMHAALGPMSSALGREVVSDEVAWCSAAVAWSFRRCGMRIPDGVTRAARSWLHGKDLVTLKEPCRGAIAVLWREDPLSWRGHVGLVEAVDKSPGRMVHLLGGNQGNAVSVANYQRSRVLAYMWPRCFDAGAFPL